MKTYKAIYYSGKYQLICQGPPTQGPPTIDAILIRTALPVSLHDGLQLQGSSVLPVVEPVQCSVARTSQI